MRLLSSCLNPLTFDDFEIRDKGTSAKKVTLMDEKEDVDKVCSEERKSSDDAGGKLTGGFFTSTQKHLVL